jgi:hypothetical protein
MSLSATVLDSPSKTIIENYLKNPALPCMNDRHPASIFPPANADWDRDNTHMIYNNLAQSDLSFMIVIL